MRAPLWLVVVSSVALAACSPSVDLTKGLQVIDVTTGWHDAGVQEDGNNKIVPAVTFKVKNVSGQKLRALQMNAIFKRVGDEEEWGSGFLTVSKSDGLGPGEVSQPFTVNSQKGYTSLDPRADMFHHSQFVDGRVLLFAKYGSVQWAKVAEYTIDRRLLNP
jgi:hypothetical protein